MAEDIDDLLDEVERKYLSSTHANSEPPLRSFDSQQISDLLQDICAENEMKNDLLQTITPTVQNSEPTGLQYSQRCSPLHIAGSATPTGHSSSGNSIACSTLRCLNCDFKVSHFDNYEWKSSTDYLFLRNHMPDFVKLRSNLVPKIGSRAYACQCCWRNVTKLENVELDRHLKWVCSKHDTAN